MSGNPVLLFLVLYPMIGAVVSYLTGRRSKKLRDDIVQFVGVSEFLIFLTLLIVSDADEPAVFAWRDFCGMGISFSLDGFRLLWGLIASFMWMMTALFSGEYFTHYRSRNRYYFFYLLTLGATVGVFLSADLYTTFLFFEIMSLTSYVWVAQDEKPESLRAAATYLAVALIGGLVLLMGLFLLLHTVGTLDMAALPDACAACENWGMLYAAGGCMLFGFGAKAGAFPLHIWLPKAHPVAPAPASALLSGILTKSGVFGILAVSCNLFLQDVDWGALLLILGVITMLLGAVLALLSVDLKRTLACSSMSQIGFILVGAGMRCMLGLQAESGLAVRGTLLHMVNHSLIKLVLFLAAGVVFMNLHRLDLNDIRGFGRKKPLLNLAFLCGALGIGGVPFFNGYVSKTLLHESITAAQTMAAGQGLAGKNPGVLAQLAASPAFLSATEWIFLISGGITVAYMMKLYICLFLEKNGDAAEQERFDAMKHYMNKKSAFALTGGAVLLSVIGVLPGTVSERVLAPCDGFMRFAADAEGAERIACEVRYFGWESLSGALISIAIGLILYLGVVRSFLMKEGKDGRHLYVNRLPDRLDLENGLYRPLLLQVLPALLGFLGRICDTFTDGLILLLRKTVYRESPLPYEREEGTILTDIAGSVGDFIHGLLNRTVRRKNPKPLAHSYRHVIALKRQEFKENSMIIARSLSFGLLLFCLGFIFTVIYLLFRT